jgi:hypothetical protein
MFALKLPLFLFFLFLALGECCAVLDRPIPD